MKSENTPSQATIAPGEVIKLETRFGALSRGRCWGKYFPDKTGPLGDFSWVAKDGGTLFLEGPGFYVVGSRDGFRREARGSFVLRAEETAAPAKEGVTS